MYPSITIAYGPGHTQAMIDFIGFDYRDFGSGHCALRDYVDGYTNPTTGEFIEKNNGGQWSRQSVVTIYPDFKTYSAIRDEHAAKMYKLAGVGR